jgi:hypothetical protein
MAIYDKMLSLYHVTITHLVYNFIRNGNIVRMALFSVFPRFSCFFLNESLNHPEGELAGLASAFP